MASVTIVTASRDRRERLLASIPHHLCLPERPPVIVVDDASADGSADAVEAAFPAVTVLRRRTSAGGAARNDGIAAAATPYVALADDDSWYAPGALARAAAILDADPRLAVINAHVVVGGTRDDATCLEMAASPLPPAPGQPGRPVLSFIACGAVVRRDAVLAVGGFDARLGIGGEEELLAWDLAARGWLMSYVPEVLAHHHPPPQDGGRPERRQRGIRNTLWTTWLRRPAGAAVRRTARQLVRLPRDRHTARALAEALGGLGWLRRERRVLPAEVERRVRMLDDAQLRRRDHA
jgi:N-acetylglucosaminyl-diphospho-decaprenol L-rhamnosyltransferase